ncbi:MAG: hypothetical protein R3F48_01055 [Candidatus Zixiibacteriota bacterium]
MTDNPKIEYPLYLFDHAGWMVVIEDETRLSYHIEDVDVMTTEYHGWDSSGREIDLYLDDSKDIAVKLLSNKCEPEKIKSEILQFISQYQIEARYVPSSGNLSMRELWEEVTAFTRANKPPSKFISWIMKHFK